jgi:hypothetical protein
MEDLFGDTPQPEREPAPPERRPLTAEDVRRKMLVLIATMRAAEAMPFALKELHQHLAMFPIMAQWLPTEEGEQLLLEFATEVDRLQKAA